MLFADLGQSENSSVTVEHMQESLEDNPHFGAAAHLIYVSDYSYADTYQSNGTDTVSTACDPIRTALSHASSNHMAWVIAQICMQGTA